MSAFLKALSTNRGQEEELGGQMSFLEHLDELRRRLIRCFVFIFLAGTLSWFVSGQSTRSSPLPSNAPWRMHSDDKFRLPVKPAPR